jgi:hypothetical protein
MGFEHGILKHILTNLSHSTMRKLAVLFASVFSISAHAQFDLSKSLGALLQSAIPEGASSQNKPFDPAKVDQTKVDQLMRSLTTVDKDFLEGLRQSRETGMVIFDVLRPGNRYYEYETLDKKKLLNKYGCNEQNKGNSEGIYSGESALLNGAIIKLCRTNNEVYTLPGTSTKVYTYNSVVLAKLSPIAEAVLASKGLADPPAAIGKARPTEYTVIAVIQVIKSPLYPAVIGDYIAILKERNPRFNISKREQDTDLTEQYISFMAGEGFDIAGFNAMDNPVLARKMARENGVNVDAIVLAKEQECGKFTRGQSLSEYLRAGGWHQNKICEVFYKESKFVEAHNRFHATVKPNPKGQLKKELFFFDGHVNSDLSFKEGFSNRSLNVIATDGFGSDGMPTEIILITAAVVDPLGFAASAANASNQAAEKERRAVNAEKAKNDL